MAYFTTAAIQSRPKQSHSLALFAALLVIVVALRAHDFGNPAIHVDEEYYLLVGDRMLHGAVPYVDVWDRKPVGLFLIFAAIRLIPGDGIIAYQMIATAFAAATAVLVGKAGRRLGASREGAFAAAVAYVLWLSLLSGRGGQSPIFYNLFVAAGGLLTLRLPDLAARRDGRAIILNGAATCALAGLAIQTKYTPMVEGAFFGVMHVVYLRRARASLVMTAGAAVAWMVLGILPTALVVAWYYQQGPATFDAFWFANFTSVALRRGYPAAKIVARLAGTTAQLLPLVVSTVIAWRHVPRSAETSIALGWLIAALVAFAMIGAFFDHYALPLMVPLTMLAAPVFGRHRVALGATMSWGAMLFLFHLTTEPNNGTSTRDVARLIKAESGRECPYVFAGDAVLYLLADACLPTPYAFPSTLAYEPERGATGVDEAAEVRRIIAGRPPVIVTMDHPLAPWNEASLAVVRAALASDYRLVLSAPRGPDRLLVYRRRDAGNR
ncbi:hypothetical protein [Sphingomonas sp.]|uniref:ArnT family glycosyltransferase n=1 Tax=Sphingomonas sp. TaxID=28214 RepID=UPI0025EEAD8A|nr:hypothetical protein [Sphingomonas sp.]